MEHACGDFLRKAVGCRKVVFHLMHCMNRNQPVSPQAILRILM